MVNNEEQLKQLETIERFRTLDQRSFLEQAFIRFLSLDRYKWFVVDWHKKGRYVYDLDRLELKIRGLIYKIKHSEEEA